MPICKKCGKKFPNRIVIDGKIKIVNTRKYCFECSPKGLHNTREPGVHEGEVTICERCGKSYIYKRGKGHRRKKCNTCISKEVKLKKKKYLIEYKGGKCEKCGYDKCISALEFHHKEGDKIFGISGNHYLSLKKLIKEVEKCSLLCANCHREEHSK